jgi:hypothetical protein
MHLKQHREATTSQGTKCLISDNAINMIYSSHVAQSPQLTPAHALSHQPAYGQGQMPQFCPASLRPDGTLPFEHTGSLFYLTTIVCQFSPILSSACGRSVTLIQETSRKEVMNNSCQIKYWPCILYLLVVGSIINRKLLWLNFGNEVTQCSIHTVGRATVRSPARTKIFKTSRADLGPGQPATNEYKRPPFWASCIQMCGRARVRAGS